jgi:tripartite-type tricarboxylate transporter receptor subunit TctC
MVSSAAGGGIDTITRAVAQKLFESWQRTVVVDNRPDGGGTLALEILANATPDGYTLYVGGGQISLAGVTKEVPFDVRKAYMPIVQMAASPYFLVITPSLPVNSVKELIAFAKTKPGVLNYGSAGLGSSIHLGIELFSFKSGIKMVHVPYKGNTTAFADLMSGQIHVMFTNPTSSVPLAKGGKVKLLATTSASRVRAFPDLPALSETIPGYEHGNSSGIYAPAGVPMGVALIINRDVSRAVNSPEVKTRIEADGSEVVPPHTPAQFRDKFIKRVAYWEEFVKTSGVKLSK